MIRRPPRSTQGVSSAASDVYKRQLRDRAERPRRARGAGSDASAECAARRLDILRCFGPQSAQVGEISGGPGATLDLSQIIFVRGRSCEYYPLPREGKPVGDFRRRSGSGMLSIQAFSRPSLGTTSFKVVLSPLTRLNLAPTPSRLRDRHYCVAD